ncbi:Protein FAR1-RELATED SEQUENCE 5 [Linum grandiflorum]
MYRILAKLNDDAGISVTSSYHAMAKSCGGRQNLNFTRADLYNLVRSIRRTPMKDGEEKMLLDYFRSEKASNQGFYYDMQIDSKLNIESIFWADARMRADYQCFGDSITFDTTYRTNNAFRPLGLFAGFNHHRNLVVFGAVLMFEETSEGFEWVFNTFLKCMQNKRPKSIFTDQCPAIANGIKKVLSLPDTFHGLCTFHINENAQKKLGRSLANDKFMSELQFLMKDVDNEEQFDTAWSAMIEACFPNSAPNGHPWLSYIHKFRRQWSSAWVKDHFTCGMRSSQLSESLNSNLRGYLQSKDNLHTFFTRFQDMLDDKREFELWKDYKTSIQQPVNRYPTNPIVSKAAEVYLSFAIVLCFHLIKLYLMIIY